MPAKSPNAAIDRSRSSALATPAENGSRPAAADTTGAKAAPAARSRSSYKGATAEEMGAKQRDISVAEFFQKNRHLLGFDNPRKALLTTVKEAVDNSLDACEEAGILPAVTVRIDVAPNGDGTLPPTPAQADRFVVTVIDNGPGIIRKNVGKVFAKLLYGSKFHRLRMSRGQQGIGISAAGMYGQLTTGKPTRVITKIKDDEHTHVFEISIDTKRNEPVEHETKTYKFDPQNLPQIPFDHQKITWDREHGTLVSIELSGKYQKGKASVDEYLELTSVANPHVELTYVGPDGEKKVFPRGVDYLPEPPREIKPHPYGIELGMLLKMLKDTQSHWLSGFLATDFSRVSTKTAEDICKTAGLSPRARPRDIVGQEAEALYKALQAARLMAPPTDCISPIGEAAIKAGLFKSIKADIYFACTRPPKVYRGNPFVIECGLAFGKGDGATARDPALVAAEELERGEALAKAEGEDDDDEVELAQVIRYANRVPLIYQQSACAMYKAVLKTAWKNYNLSQSRGAPPQGPMVIFIHMASVWVPFTSEAKEAIAEYDEIMSEIKLALQDCGRKLGIWLRKRQHAKSEFERRSVFQRYIEEVAEACKRIKRGKLDSEKLKKQLQKIAEEITGGEDTDKILNKKKKEEDEELAGAVIRTADGVKGDLNALALQAAGVAPQIAAAPAAEPPPAPETGELIEGAIEQTPRKKVDLSTPQKKAKPAAKKKKRDDSTLFE